MVAASIMMIPLHVLNESTTGIPKRPGFGAGALNREHVGSGDPPVVANRDKHVGRLEHRLQDGPDEQLLVTDQRRDAAIATISMSTNAE
ncbi:hypothetical protein ACVJGD_008165 [Bradyrhizobium sp. USDA 10063]